MKKVLFTATVDSHILCFHIPFLKLFKEMGYEVHVATNGNGEIPYCDKKIFIPFERSPYKINNFKAIKALKKVIMEEKYDIIHTHTPMGAVVTRLAAKKARKKYHTRVIYTAHGFHFYKGAPLLNWMLFYPVEKYLSKYTDTLITINKEDYERAKHKFGNRCKDIQYVPGVGIDEEKFSIKLDKNQKKELKKSLGLKDDDFVLTYVARLDKNKNQGFLIEVMKKLVCDYPNIHLLLVGPDELNGEYQKQAKDILSNVHFLGLRKDVPQLLSITDISVSSSLREGLPVNILEAMTMGVPVVATDTRGVRDLIRDEENGYVVNPNDLLTFKTRILKLYSNNKLIDAISKKNLEDIKRFYLNVIIIEMNKIYFGIYQNGMKCVFVHDFYFTRKEECVYGAGQFSYSSLWKPKYLQFFHKVTVIAREDFSDDNVFNKAVLSGKNVSFIGTSNMASINFLKNYRKNKKIIKSIIFDNDIVIVRLPSLQGLLACSILKKIKKEYIIEVVGSAYESYWYHDFIKGKIFAPFVELITRKHIKNAQNVIYVTNSFLQKKYPNSHNTLSFSDVVLSMDEDNISNKVNKYKKGFNNKIIVGLCGPLNVMYKGHKAAIDVLSILVKEFDVEMHFLGDGDKTKWIKYARKKNASSYLYFDEPRKTRQEMDTWYDELDFLLMPSKTEGMPRVCIEAMSRGVEIISSNVGEFPYLLLDRNIFKPSNYRGMANRIIHLIRNLDEIVDDITINYEKSRMFSTKSYIQKREEYMYDILNKNNGGK